MSLEPEGFYLRLGQRIQDLRKQRRLTQEQLGVRLVPQVTRASIANIESGKQRVLAHTLVQVAEALEVSIVALVREEPEVVEPAVRQQVEAQLQDRLKLSPDDMLRLTRKLGLGGPGGDDE